MQFLIFSGSFLFLFGVLSLLPPESIRRFNNAANKVLVDFDQKFYDLRVGIGVSLVLVSFLAFFIVYYWVKTYST